MLQMEKKVTPPGWEMCVCVHVLNGVMSSSNVLSIHFLAVIST